MISILGGYVWSAAGFIKKKITGANRDKATGWAALLSAAAAILGINPEWLVSAGGMLSRLGEMLQ